jgi:hypothetical protein
MEYNRHILELAYIFETTLGLGRKAIYHCIGSKRSVVSVES